jgi:hypothetical protein
VPMIVRGTTSGNRVNSNLPYQGDTSSVAGLFFCAKNTQSDKTIELINCHWTTSMVDTTKLTYSFFLPFSFNAQI